MLLVVTSLTIFVFRPTAAIAITIKNLLSHLSGAKTSATTPMLVANVVISEASTKYSIKLGTMLLILTS